MVDVSVDDAAPVTMGMLRLTSAELRAEMAAMKAEFNAKFDEIILQLRSNATGVELVAPIIPAGNVVVENNTVYAHASKALLRRKGRTIRVVACFRSSKKCM